MWLNPYIDVVSVYYHCWILLASRTHLFLLIRNVPSSAIERPIAILQRSHLKLETTSDLTVLSELGHLCLVFFFQSMHWGNFAAFVALLQKWNEPWASKSKNQPVSLDFFFCPDWDAGVWVGIGKIRAVLTCSHNAPWPKGCQQAQNFQAPWKSEWFLQAVLLVGDCSLGLWSDPTPARSDHSQLLGILGASKGFCTHVW